MAVAVAALVAGWTSGADAQQLRGSRTASRAQLTALLDSLQQRLPTVERGEDRRFLQEQIDMIGTRLRQGDVQPGDVVRLRVTGEDRWTGDFTVDPLGQVDLPDVDPLDLTGTLYSEVEESIASQLARYLREPRIDAQVLKRIGIMGAVGNPGFYVVEGSELVSEVIMTAGGPSQQAKVEDVDFRRQGRTLHHGDQIVWQNRSLDELGIQSGDEVFVPAKGRSFPTIVLGLITGAAGLTWTLIRIF